MSFSQWKDLKVEINKIFFVGLGGAGQRHLRIFKQLLSSQTDFSAFRSTGSTPLLNPDFSVNHEISVVEKYGLTLFSSIDEGLETNPDLIVISTPSALHFDVAKKAAEKKINIFIEKPFSHNLIGIESFANLVISNNLYFLVSFQRRFHPYLCKIKETLDSGRLGKIITAGFNVSSYVPAWHPYEDFKNLYACKPELGGGVLLTEIHELDLCFWYFGMPDYVSCAGGNWSSIKLEVEDTAQITLEYADFAVSLNLCFMNQKNQRSLYIDGSDGYLEWSANGNILKINYFEDGNEEVFVNPGYTNDEMFIAQADYFLNSFSRSESEKYIDIARSSLTLVQAAKESMQYGLKVKP
ncbi:MAG: Gfo/Idh/MocA family oxidoreductase [Mariniphaga sp.]